MSETPADAPTSADEPGPSTPSRVWPHVRAVLIAAHIVAVVLLAIPDAGGAGLSRSGWKNPTVRAELDGWAQRLGMRREDLEVRLWSLARAWTDTLVTVRAPLSPYVEYVGVRQTWRMFVAPHRHPAKLQVDVERDGEWATIYLARSSEHDWRAGQLDHVRMRAIIFRYAWERYAKDYRALARWIATRAALDFPDATRVRIRLYRFRTPTPEEVRTDAIPAGEHRSPIVLELERFR